jgi:membrane-bound lytic murein transglycosylase F
MKELLHRKMNIRVRLTFPLLFLAIMLSSCLSEHDRKMAEILEAEKENMTTRVETILERGKLIAITDYNSINYFIYRGEPMGYEFEKLKIFADYLGVPLEIKIENDINDAIDILEEGECDLIAMGLTITKNRKERIAFTNPHTETRQVLVQRLPENWRKMRTWDDIEKELVRNILDLEGETIYIQKGSIFYKRLVNLSEEIGGTIHIVEDEEREVEQLIEAVAGGEIDYTVADEHVALVNSKYHPGIDVKTPVSFEQNLAWAVNKNSDSLLTVINNWLVDFNNSLTSRYIYNKYFKNSRSVYMARSDYHSVNGGKLSQYDEIIREIAEKNGLDWRLVASLIYQESQFMPDVQSWAGAFGLMQLMPATAAIYGVDSTSSPRDQIEAGIKFLVSLDKQLPEEISNPAERMKFMLAAYNVGIAHVFDARRLAEKHGKDPNVWTNNVDYFLLNKSNPKYYRDSVVRYGYARGDETYNFVIEILDRYEHYKNVIEN